MCDRTEGENMKVYLKRKQKLEEDETRAILKQICSAVHYMHSKGILHRDLKLDNMVMKNDGVLKIADFGLSTSLDGEENRLQFCGSPSFIAPEVLSKRKYTTASDIWSLGVSVYYLLTGHLPYVMDSKHNFTSLYFNILQGCDIPKSLSTGIRELLEGMLTIDESDRITMEQILQHPWLQSNS